MSSKYRIKLRFEPNTVPNPDHYDVLPHSIYAATRHMEYNSIPQIINLLNSGLLARGATPNTNPVYWGLAHFVECLSYVD